MIRIRHHVKNGHMYSKQFLFFDRSSHVSAVAFQIQQVFLIPTHTTLQCNILYQKELPIEEHVS